MKNSEILSSLKMPGLMFYVGTFTAIPAVSYCVFTALELSGMFLLNTGMALVIMASVIMVLMTFFYNISMLYVGRLCRRNSKSSYWDWTSLCYSLLIFLNILFLFFIISKSSDYSSHSIFLENHQIILVAFAINVLISAVIVPLPAVHALSCSCKVVLLAGLASHFISCILFWILSTVMVAQSADYSLGFDILFSQFPYNIFCGFSASTWTVCALLSLILFLFGYFTHMFIVALSEGRKASAAFKSEIICLAVFPFAVYGISLIDSFIKQKQYENLVAENSGKYSIQKLEEMYYGGKSSDGKFWNEFIQYANELNGDDADGAFEKLNAMVSAVDSIPKADRDFNRHYEGTSDDIKSVMNYSEKMAVEMASAINESNGEKAALLMSCAKKTDALVLDDVYGYCNIIHVLICKKIFLPFVNSKLADKDELEKIRILPTLSDDMTRKFCDNADYWHSLSMITILSISGNDNSLCMSFFKASRWIMPQFFSGYYRNKINGFSSEKDIKAVESFMKLMIEINHCVIDAADK